MKARNIVIITAVAISIVLMAFYLLFSFGNSDKLSSLLTKIENESEETLESVSTMIDSDELNSNPEKIEIIGGFLDESREENKTEVVSKYKIIGHFVNTEWGDYSHLNIKDLKENIHGFFISAGINMEVLTRLEEDSDLSRRKIEVIWYKVNKYIPEARSSSDINVAMNIKILD